MKHINKYSYQIKEDQSLGIIAVEFAHNIKSRIWVLKTLSNLKNLNDSTSLERTKKWVLENHPELLI